ncbi:transposase [Cupriavidus basilensis OR16]|uniref:Transposase n=1 Tax=Cupriavidus basilensis OR16 TaxID=1127483 RepID=H1SGU2_9BURK|nr:transposase [Cupriavidus basilensis OR16]
MRHVSTKLLHVFVLLMEYRDLNAVAACTQGRVPTIAYSLARLREITGDPLFIKRNGTLEPTAHALRLEQTARQILSKWAHLIRPPAPATEEASPHRRISIGFSPSIGDPVITEILTAMCEQFPDDRFMTRPVFADAALAAQLSSGELDCAFVVDSHFVPEDVALHNIMATPRRLVSVTRPGGHDDAGGRHEWILLQEDTEPGSPLQGFLNRLAHEPAYRETVVPSWHT